MIEKTTLVSKWNQIYAVHLSIFFDEYLTVAVTSNDEVKNAQVDSLGFVISFKHLWAQYYECVHFCDFHIVRLLNDSASTTRV